VSIVPDTGPMAGTLPPCPSWCALPPDHDAPEDWMPDTLRAHVVAILDDHEIGIVEVVRNDVILGGIGGPVFAGDAVVEVDFFRRKSLDPAEAAKLAEALVRAAELVECDRAVAR
jgi:hypothetical protein